MKSDASRDISVVAIIPLYNGARYVEEAIRSVLGQTMKVDEFIVVDDGSTDNGPAIVERLAREHPIRVLQKPNGGQSAARNFAVSQSKSRLIALLDQDDVWYPHHIEELVKPFRQRRGIPLGWVYSDLDEIDIEGSLICRAFLRTMGTEHPKRHLFSCLRQDMFVVPTGTLICREAFEAVGGFDERLSGYEDDDLFLRMFRAGFDNVYVEAPTAQWRLYQGSTSTSSRMDRSRMIYAEKLFEMFPDDPLHVRYYARDLIAPRFWSTLLGVYMSAAEKRDSDKMRRATEHMAVIAPHLARRRRAFLPFVLPLLRLYPYLHAGIVGQALVRRLVRKLA
jgi:glycosyltransferase involved in cell wall biosynthesis